MNRSMTQWDILAFKARCAISLTALAVLAATVAQVAS